MKRAIGLALTAAAALAFAGLPGLAHADTAGPITFENAPYTLGSIDGQGGWSSTGGFDQGVVAQNRFTSFGGQSLRISSAVTSGSFGDQTFSPPLTNAAGEDPLLLQHFDSTFSIGSTQNTVQPGLHLSVSPDDGQGARMSYLRFDDQSDGIHVFFDDVTDLGPLPTVATFNETDIATIDRTSAHTVRFSIDFVPGPGNDVARIFIDGVLKVTGTTWEDYYRYDPEAAGSGNLVSPVSTLLFREGGDAAGTPGTGGFLIDNVSLTSAAGPCQFSVTGSVMTLVTDCITDSTITVPPGYTLDGSGHKITAVDPAGGYFTGPIVTNGGNSVSVKNVTITASNLAENCGTELKGLLVSNAAGTIDHVTVNGIRQGSRSGCQLGNAIVVSNFTSGTTPSSPALPVTITNNQVADYQKNGITVKGGVIGTVTGNTVTGNGPIDYIAQNGIQISFGATALISKNTVSGNWYTPTSWTSCGLLFYNAGGVKQKSNNLFANEVNLCNAGRGGGSINP